MKFDWSFFILCFISSIFGGMHGRWFAAGIFAPSLFIIFFALVWSSIVYYFVKKKKTQ